MVVARILLFSGTRLDSTFPGSRSDPFLVLDQMLPFTGTCPDSTILRYLPGFYLSPVLVGILLFSGPHLDSTFLGTCPDRCLVLAQILPFSSTSPNSTLLWYSSRFYISRYLLGRFFDTSLDSTLLRYSPVPFSGTRPDSTPHR